MQIPHILGLDIGANSVGWAMVECRPDADVPLLPIRLTDLNSYIFQEALNKDKVPFNAERRKNRLMRRQTARRSFRRRELVGILQSAGFLPTPWDEKAANAIDRDFAARVLGKPDAKGFDEWTPEEKHWASPFAIRAFALDNDLKAHEFGRVVLHLHRRRGFRSNRGAKYLDLLRHLGLSDLKAADDEKPDSDSGETAEEKKKRRAVLDGIPRLAAQMDARGPGATVGKHVWECARESGTAPARITTSSVHFEEVRREAKGKPAGTDKVALYAEREMTEKEFEAVCNRQMDRLSGLTDKTRNEIREALFEQWPVQSPPPPSRRLKNLRYNAVGNCSLEPRRQRADKSALVSQEFRTRAVINNIVMADDGEVPSQELRDKLFAASRDPAQLNKDGRLPWTQVAKILGVGKVPHDRDHPDMKNGLVGDRTRKSLAEAMGEKEWARFADDAKALCRLVDDLLSLTDKLALYKCLIRRWKFTGGADGTAFKLATLELESGHMKYSRRAMKRMLPHLRDGENEHYAREAAEYGEPRTVAKPGDPAEELLPLKAVPETGNPRVQRAMFAVRRIVNAAARQWGAPAEIRVEMPREMKAAKKHRRDIEKEQAANRERNAEAEDALIKLADAKGGYELKLSARLAARRVTRADREKYKMWKFEQDGKCVYCGEPVGLPQLMSEAFEVDHIIPQSSFGQNYMNTVVSCRNCNQAKGARTPWQAWRGTERWDEIAARADLDRKKKAEAPRLPKEKWRRILNKKEDFLSEEDFCKRALQDTQYIAVQVCNFLRAAGVKVQVSRGQATAILRREWELNDILPRHPDDELKDDDIQDGVVRYDAERAKAAKNRRDHRHHAVDALVVALTDHAMLMRLVRHHQQRRDKSETRLPQFAVPESWEGDLREQAADRLREKIVSHQKRRKVRGKLHKDKIYGRGFYTEPESWQPTKTGRKRIECLLRRKPDATGDTDGDGDFEWIRDAKVYAALAEWIAQPPGTPLPDGLKEIRVARRFYFYRRRVENALKVAGGKWRETGGKSGWIVDKGIHEVLNEWLKKHGDDIKGALQSDPPETRARNGRRGNPIRTVRMGMIKSGVKTLAPKARNGRPAPPPRRVELRNNRHLEIFRKDGERERKLRMVTLLEAAQRLQREEPVVNQIPDPEWGDGWEFQCYLAENDLVVFNREEVREEVRKILDKHRSVFQSVIYRVQNMSMTGARPDMLFRHHSVTGTDGKDKHGLIRVTSAADLVCEKKEIGVLGSDRSALER